MTVIKLPVDYEDVSLSEGTESTFWKQIIPLDEEISYGGKSMKFSKELLGRIKANYDAKVTDGTAFQLVDDQNRHDTEEDVAKNRNWDPQRYRGDVEELSLTDKGLFGKFKLTSDGAKLIRDNPKLGVSASIKPNYVGQDGTTHDFVLRHVVGTLDPKIKHMSPWQREGINLSVTDDPNEEVFDLTTTEPAPADTQTPNENQVTVDKAEYEQLKAKLAEFDKGEDLLDQILAEEDSDDVTTNLSQDSAPAIDPRIVALENRAAKAEWNAAKANYIKDGVPQGMLNLCDEIMSSADDVTINLSEGGEADPREVIHKLLSEAKGQVDLSDEQGHGQSPDERQADQNADEEWATGFINQYNMDLF